MKRSKWIESVRERLVDIVVECNTTLADEAEMTTFEKLQIQKRLKETVGYIDTKLKGK